MQHHPWTGNRLELFSLVAAALFGGVVGCREVADYAAPPAGEAAPADHATGQPPPEEPDALPRDEQAVDLVNPDPSALQPSEPPIAEAALDLPPAESTADATPAEAPPESELVDLDELFSDDPDDARDDEAAPPPTLDDARDADARSDPFADDPLPELWQPDEDDQGDDGYDEMFADVQRESSGEPAPTSAEDEPVAEAGVSEVAVAEAEPALPEWSPERPARDPEAEEAQPSPEPPLTTEPNATQPQPTPPAPGEPTALEWVEWTPLEDDAPDETPAPSAEPQPEKSRLVIDIDNTRRLAWLLGARFSLSVIASQEHSEAPRDWAPAALAEMLGVTAPTLPAASDADGALTQLVQAAREMSTEIAQRYGQDHAALLEIALKTNALAAVYERRPQLAAPVARAVEKAAEHTGLEPELWDSFLESISGSPSADEVRRAVFDLHARADRRLRDEP